MCVAKEYQGEGCCTCMPYKDGLLLTGQITVGIAFACMCTSGLIPFLWALATVGIVLSSCCCAMDKCGILTGASFSIVALVFAGTWAFFYFVAAHICNSDDDEDDDYYDVTYYGDDCNTLTTVGIVNTIGAVLFLTGSIDLFMFGCSKLDMHLAEKAAKNEAKKQQAHDGPVIEAVQVKPQAAPHGGAQPVVALHYYSE